jgi:glycine betaine/proline transport system substrate-binding protein
MRIGKRSILIVGIVMIFLTVTLTGNALARNKTAELAYVEWACATANAFVVKEILESKMDYQIELTPVSAAAMWQALASGDVDFITTAWLPTTHGHYLERVKDNVDDLGPNLVGTRIGLVVPTYVEIDSISELNAHADKFDRQIT